MSMNSFMSSSIEVVGLAANALNRYIERVSITPLTLATRSDAKNANAVFIESMGLRLRSLQAKSAKDGMAFARGDLLVVFSVVVVETGARIEFFWLGQVR